ncbi:MAG: ABC transporter ATP-binding protein [Phycisphaerales bacterium]
MLRLTDLRKSFGAVTAVDGLTLEVRKGEVFGLLGPNGAGKSTTIGMAVGLLAPDAGSVEIEGVGSPTDARARRSLGVAPQALALYEEMTAEENLRFFGSLYGLAGSGLAARVDAVLRMVGLEQRRGDRVKTYSGGMKRRINLAAAMVHDPPVILLDEPTAGVDPQSRNNLLEVVRGLASGGKTVVYTTHYMEEASRLCDRIAIMDHGKVIAMGTVVELTGRFGGKSVVTVHRGEAGAERIETDAPLRELERVMAGGGVTNVRVDQPDLESVFLSLTGRSLRDE